VDACPCPRRYILFPTSQPTGASMTDPHDLPTNRTVTVPPAPEGPASDGSDPEGSARFRRTLVRVMSMQVVALLVLWWLQARYGH